MEDWITLPPCKMDYSIISNSCYRSLSKPPFYTKGGSCSLGLVAYWTESYIFLALGETPWENVTAEEWEGIFRANVESAFFCIKAVLPGMRKESLRRPQLDPAKYPRLVLGHSPDLDYLQISQSYLRSLSSHSYRGSGTFPSVSSGNQTFSPIHLSVMQHYDRFRSGASP